jgi:hypothetical protein
MRTFPYESACYWRPPYNYKKIIDSRRRGGLNGPIRGLDYELKSSQLNFDLAILEPFYHQGIL